MHSLADLAVIRINADGDFAREDVAILKAALPLIAPTLYDVAQAETQRIQREFDRCRKTDTPDFSPTISAEDQDNAIRLLANAAQSVDGKPEQILLRAQHYIMDFYDLHECFAMDKEINEDQEKSPTDEMQMFE